MHIWHFEKEMETKKQIKQATRYPTFVLFAIAVAMVLMNVLVIPQFAAMFAKFNTELPWATRVLLASSNLFVNHWKLMLAVLIGFIWALMCCKIWKRNWLLLSLKSGN